MFLNKLLVGVSLTLATLLAATNAEEVVTLTEANFKESIAANPFILVEFYAPWCGHCKKLAPEYEKAAVALKDMEPKVVLAKVDATVEESLAKEFGVRGFPTLKWFVNGQVNEYSGGRDEKTIVSWIQKKTGPPAQTIGSADALKTFRKEAEAVVVGIFKNDDQAKVFLTLAQADDEVPYGICIEGKDGADCAAVAKVAGVEASAFPEIIIYQDFDAGSAVYKSDVNAPKEISKFIAGNILPTIIPFSQKMASKIFGGQVKTHLLAFVDGEAKDLVEKLKPVAVAKKGEVLFVTVDKSESRIVDFFGVKPEEMPTLRMVNMGETGVKKYKFTASEITTDAVTKFVADYFDGKVPMDLKSEDPLPESEQGPVRVVVGKDFEQVVSQPGKDVLVEFYAPWCGHCKKLEPEYNALGEHFKDNENIVIAKMDATANEVERVSVSGFPTLKFFPADSDEILDYDGPRTKDGLIEFIQKNAKSLNK